MSMIAGTTAATTGLAKRIYDNFIANSAACGFGASPSTAAQAMLKTQAWCIAQAVVDEISANAQIVSGAAVVTVTAAQGGLQTSAAAGSPTTGPGSNQSIFGTCTGQIA